MTHVGCNCPIGSPFRWRESARRSIFVEDRLFASRADGMSYGEAQTAVVERKRASGDIFYGTIALLSGSSEEDARRRRAAMLLQAANA